MISAPALNRLLMFALLCVATLWLVLPFIMAVLWSLVDPAEPWTPEHLLPPVMSTYRWEFVWSNSLLKPALINSYVLAPLAAVCALTLAIPTALALGRYRFRGKETAKLVAIFPLFVPEFVMAIFFISILYQIGIAQYRLGGILFAHTLLFLPYAIRILTVSFEQVRQDHINAARDLGARPVTIFWVAYWPALKPGFLAAFLIVFVKSFQEFAVAYVVGQPGFVTLPTLVYSSLGQDFNRPNAAVLSLILAIPNIILMLFLEKLLKSANPTLASGKG